MGIGGAQQSFAPSEISAWRFRGCIADLATGLQGLSRQEVQQETGSGRIAPAASAVDPAMTTRDSGGGRSAAVAGRGPSGGDILQDWESKVTYRKPKLSS